MYTLRALCRPGSLSSVERCDIRGTYAIGRPVDLDIKRFTEVFNEGGERPLDAGSPPRPPEGTLGCPTWSIARYRSATPCPNDTHCLSTHWHRDLYGDAVPPDAEAIERRRSFGQKIRELRVAKGLSQEALSVRADLHRTYVASVERGERNPSLDAIWKLADGLVESPSVFFIE